MCILAWHRYNATSNVHYKSVQSNFLSLKHVLRTLWIIWNWWSPQFNSVFITVIYNEQNKALFIYCTYNIEISTTHVGLLSPLSPTWSVGILASTQLNMAVVHTAEKSGIQHAILGPQPNSLACFNFILAVRVYILFFKYSPISSTDVCHQLSLDN